MGLMSDVDERVLGKRGIGYVSAIVTLLLLAGTIAAIANDHPFLGAVCAVTGTWTGFWAGVRLKRVRA